jgi:transcriptional regulator with XRE-family HTH domain
MSSAPPPEDIHALIRVLLALARCSQEKLADRADIAPNTLSRYCTGASTPNRAMVERLAEAAGVSLLVVDFFLLPAIATVRLSSRRAAGTGELSILEIFDHLGGEMEAIGRKLVEAPLPLQEDRDDQDAGWFPADQVRKEALDLWNRLQRWDEEDRLPLVERWPEFQHPGLAELLCHLSEEAASDDADRALRLARLARRIAELAPGDPARKRRLVGYVAVFHANGLRVAGQLADARNEMRKGLALWEAGDGAATFLAEWRLLDRDASLLRDERQFARALSRLQEAFDAAPAEHRGRILLNKSAVLEQMGDGVQALQVLRQAKPLIHPTREPRLYLTLRFNVATSLCLLGKFKVPERMLPKIQEQAAALGLELTNLRVKWLAARIHAGRGHLDQAAAALDEVRQDFTRLTSPWDCSLVTLELATVHLRQGRTAHVREIADQLFWVFEAQGLHLEALAALTLFRNAALQETATVEFTDRMARYLRMAQGDPDLRFGG